jgi:uncharacterized tellurite resistance protein B-like protein
MGWLDDTTADIKALGGAFLGGAAAAGKQRAALLGAVTLTTKLFDSTVLLNRGVSTQIGMNTELIDQYVALAAKSMVFEMRNKELNKTFGISSTGAAELSQKLQELAIAQGFSGEQAMGYASSIKKMLPSFKQQEQAGSKTYESLQRIQHVLTTNLGLTEEATEAYTLYASKNGKNADTTMAFASALAGALGDTDGSMGYMKQAIEGIAAAGAETQLQFGKIPGNLEVATIKAKALGFELDELADTGKHLLDIESSIGQELEYQLLSGHRLVGNEKASAELQGKSLTNAYREATLRGNMSDAANVMNTILEQEGEVLEDNLFARKQMADLMGIEEGQLSRALQKKKLLSSDDGLRVLMKLDGTDLDKAAGAMLKSGEMSQEAFDELSALNDTRTTDDIMKQQLTVAAESLVTLQSMLKDGQKNQVEALRATLTDQTGIQAFKKDVMLKLETEDELKGAGRNENIGALIAQATTDSPSITKMKSYDATTGKEIKNDAVIPAGYGSRILSFPEDTLQPDIAFNNNDYIVASTQEPTNNSTGMITGAAPVVGAATDAGIMAMARMIVAAINSAKGSNLFGATSMNDSIYQP